MKLPLIVLSGVLCGAWCSTLAQNGPVKPVLSATPATSAPGQVDSTAAVGSPSNALVSPTYVLGPGDVIQVTVWKEGSFSGSYTIRPDGVISIPLLGDVPSSGMTPTKLSEDIKNRLKKYVTDPLVTVIVQAVNSKRVFMVGEIGKVGPLPLTPDMTPLEAIATAGGPSTYANTKHIYILRTVSGKKQKIPFDYKKAVKTGDTQGITLQTGDTIVVP